MALAKFKSNYRRQSKFIGTYYINKVLYLFMDVTMYDLIVTGAIKAKFKITRVMQSPS